MLIIGLVALLAVVGITMLLLPGVNVSPNVLCSGPEPPHCQPYFPIPI